MKLLYLAVALVLVCGCTHHSVRVGVAEGDANLVTVTEEVRPWPVTMVEHFAISLPPGKYSYSGKEYELQTNWPEKPVRTIKCEDVKIINGQRPIDGGWVAVFRKKIEIRLLSNGSPDTINGVYEMSIPFVTDSDK